jgi:hypothetical protein
MSKAVVLARSVKPEWLDKTVEILLDNNDSDRNEIKEIINEYLSNYIKSSTNLRKTREILLNIWFDIDEEILDFRTRAFEIYKETKQSDRLGIHWAMMLLAFPIFKDLCIIIGKLADMQDEVQLSQIRRRVFDLWGERTTLLHSIDKNIKTLKDFNVLEQKKPGVYKVIKHEIKNKEVACMLLYAVFKSSDKLYHSFSDIEKFMELFPFESNLELDDLNQFGLFTMDRIGGETVVSIVK